MPRDDLRVCPGDAVGLWEVAWIRVLHFLANELRYVWVDRSFSVAHSAVLAFRLKETDPGGMRPGPPRSGSGLVHTRSYGRCLDAVSGVVHSCWSSRNVHGRRPNDTAFTFVDYGVDPRDFLRV